MAEQNQSIFSLQRLMLAMVFFAAAAGAFSWMRYLMPGQRGMDQLIAGLLFSIPALVVGGCVCLAISVRGGLLTSVVLFVELCILTALANILVPILK